ncbi:uncharacterized protein BT62DRAFT_933311 [Guyanagaster necrorhizus]|uniref:Uncharacterized protein n=1 Tax=Guyanagaster necrorhizus TaxID=856835 RepID=A0A9P8ASI5_9AGAR|nr:uncharacterized protein BT62DRAFT_933311 [Guyanagaster necrorhizus MCA 3950]KAG7444907.1 hypothetical protein BT62DRAFT_933311 [Guyanagaster necrorhizus MCA 3950]
MAKWPDGGCSKLFADTTDSDAPWFKIQQSAFDLATSTWASDILAKNNASYDVTMLKMNRLFSCAIVNK